MDPRVLSPRVDHQGAGSESRNMRIIKLLRSCPEPWWGRLVVRWVGAGPWG